MDTVIKKITTLSKKHNLVTCAEVSHWSITSHKFQFRLYRALHSVGFDHFSTERLGFIDAILMNAWLSDEISISLDRLYSDVLLFGGLGTYLVLAHFKGRNTRPTIVGCEVDVFGQQVKSHTVHYLQKLLSPDYGASLDFRNLELLGTPVTAVDKQFARAIKTAILDARNTGTVVTAAAMKYRIQVLHRAIVNVYKTSRMFMIGFHMSRRELAPIVPLSIGMAAYKKELAGIEVSQLLTTNNLDVKDLGAGAGADTLFPELFQKEVVKKMWKWNIVNWNEYYEGTPFERKYRGMYALVAARRSKQVIYQKGALPVAYVEGEVIPFNGVGRAICDYDYIVVIPHSKFEAKMYV